MPSARSPAQRQRKSTRAKLHTGGGREGAYRRDASYVRTKSTSFFSASYAMRADSALCRASVMRSTWSVYSGMHSACATKTGWLGPRVSARFSAHAAQRNAACLGLGGSFAQAQAHLVLRQRCEHALLPCSDRGSAGSVSAARAQHTRTHDAAAPSSIKSARACESAQVCPASSARVHSSDACAQRHVSTWLQQCSAAGSRRALRRCAHARAATATAARGEARSSAGQTWLPRTAAAPPRRRTRRATPPQPRAGPAQVQARQEPSAAGASAAVGLLWRAIAPQCAAGAGCDTHRWQRVGVALRRCRGGCTRVADGRLARRRRRSAQRRACGLSARLIGRRLALRRGGDAEGARRSGAGGEKSGGGAARRGAAQRSAKHAVRGAGRGAARRTRALRRVHRLRSAPKVAGGHLPRRA